MTSCEKKKKVNLTPSYKGHKFHKEEKNNSFSAKEFYKKKCKFGKHKIRKLMEQVTFETDNQKDVNLLIAIAEKLGIKKHVISKKAKVIKENKREDLFRIIDAGADVSNFGDPSSWQKVTRKASN